MRIWMQIPISERLPWRAGLRRGQPHQADGALGGRRPAQQLVYAPPRVHALGEAARVDARDRGLLVHDAQVAQSGHQRTGLPWLARARILARQSRLRAGAAGGGARVGGATGAVLCSSDPGGCAAPGLRQGFQAGSALAQCSE